MYVSSLKLTNFRNFEHAEFTFDQAKTAIWADNARGKSNVLEALYFLALAKSGRGARDRDVLRWGANYFVIEAQIEREDRSFPIRIAYDPLVGKKQASVAETSLPRLSDLIGAFNAVLFSPEDVDLVLREPAQRRRPRRLADDPAVESHRHHPGVGLALAVECVEAVACRLEEVHRC